MSLHRVLPIPPALSDRGLSQRWGARPDSFERARTMIEKRPSTAHKSSPQLSTPPQQSSSSPRDGRYSISSHDSVEDCPSPHATHPTPTPRKRSTVSWDQETLDEEAATSICLCQPDPKVPRPRNAFILYRQHYQASVVASNPGLANPQISKVIGDHWRKAPDEVKNHWRLLAEEEKARHQKQYPGYRYQPRKSTRTNSVSSTLPLDDSPDPSSARCTKCGGRSISAAAMMSVSTGSLPFHRGHRTSSTVAYSPSRTIATPTNSGTGRSIQGVSSPASAQAPLPGYRYHSQQSKSAALMSPHSKRSEAHDLAQHSPESKRRRVNTSVAFVPVRGPSGPLSPFPFPPNHQRGESLPRLDMLGPSSLHSPFTMGPPPRHHNQNRSEKSLTLAPLQQGSASASAAPGDSQAKSLEAMILSIPIINKIRTLARISAPLTAASPYSPSAPTTATTSTATSNAVITASQRQTSRRGLVVAIDAADPTAVKQLTRTLAYALSEHDVKVIATSRPDTRIEPSFQSYLRLVNDYHTLSTKIKEHIAIPATVKNAGAGLSPRRPNKRRLKDYELERKEESPLSPKSTPHRSPPAATPPMDEEDDDHDHYDHREQGKEGDEDSDEEHTDDSESVKIPKFPIAILPAWQLTHTDAFACSVEIADRYSPIDHWQWGATVWRGVIGADITIAVRADVGDDSPVKSDSSKNGEKDRAANTGVPSGGPKTGSIGSQGGGNSHPSAVEVKLDEPRAVIVKGESEGGVAEGSLRRVGFEVGEWVRDWADKELGRKGA